MGFVGQELDVNGIKRWEKCDHKKIQAHNYSVKRSVLEMPSQTNPNVCFITQFLLPVTVTHFLFVHLI